MNKCLSLIQSKSVDIVGQGLWMSEMDEVLKTVMGLWDYIKPGVHYPDL